MKTKNNTLESSIQKINDFNKARGWNPLPSDLAKSIVLEAAELLEHFQWDDTNSKSKNDSVKNKNWTEIGEEVADVFWYLVNFCNKSGIDLNNAVLDKLEKNEIKYPAKMFNGKHNEKFYREQKRKYREKKKK